MATDAASIAGWKWLPATNGTDTYAAANTLNQYPSVGGQALSYDTRGNLTGDGVWTYTYDAENRMLSAVKTGTNGSFLYDPLGRRVKKQINTARNWYLSDGADEIAEYTGGTAATLAYRYVPGPAIDQPIAMVTAAGAKTYFHTNRQGSVIAMSDSSGNLAEGPVTYDSYGNASSTTGVPFKFTGRRLDAEIGLYYYRARCYMPALGRFCQTDPVGYGAGMNLYGYVGNDPIDRLDPTGLTCETDPKSGAVTSCKFDSNKGRPTNQMKDSANNYLKSVTKAVKALQTLDPKTKVQITVNGKMMTITAGEAASTMIGRNLVADFSNTKPGVGAGTGPNEQGVMTTTVPVAGLAGAPVPGVQPVGGSHIGEIDQAKTVERNQMVQAVHDMGLHGSTAEQATFGTVQQILGTNPNWNSDHQGAYNQGAAQFLDVPYVPQ